MRCFSKLPLLMLFLCVAGCDDKPQLIHEDADTPVPTRVETAAPPLYSWDVSTVDYKNAGLQTQLTKTVAGYPAVAYFSRVFEIPDVVLPDFPGLRMQPSEDLIPAPNRTSASPTQWQLPDDWEIPGDGQLPEAIPLFELRYAEFDGSDWTITVVDTLARARGFSLIQSSTGPMVSYQQLEQGIDPEPCAATMVMVAQHLEGVWTSTVVAEIDLAQQDDGATTPIPEDETTPTPEDEATPVPEDETTPTPGDLPDVVLECEMVGAWSSLAESSQGRLGVTYRRLYLDTDNFPSDDAQEFLPVIRGNDDPTLVRGGIPQLVDTGLGVGFFSDIQYATDPQGTEVPHVVYFNRARVDPEESGQFGLWFARYDYQDANWDTQEVQANRDWVGGPQLQMAIRGDEIYVVLFAYTGKNTTVFQDLILLHSQDRGTTWESDFVVTSGRAGSFPSMAFDDNGNMAISYYGCGAPTDKRCSAEYDALMLASLVQGVWHYDTVAALDDKMDGLFTALTFIDGQPVIAARATDPISIEGDHETALRVYFGSRL